MDILEDGSCLTGYNLEDEIICAHSTLNNHMKPLIEDGLVAKRKGGGYYRPDRVRD